ncbi:hypothetical protein B0293_03850 [Amycolatopsis azurea DSM 43854]|uniref:Uncharacterized protein n=2 Tax=Amycolatopsis azurea TaxID=36819 RepID=M2PI87_9PSEU|nr:hypothetical protein C791_6216 [Amycolatopsis azurea DSM 43854]OOC08028.1 hypothetical protein B0293_03850 [Amycolatopsis azurea DSM 43854]
MEALRNVAQAELAAAGLPVAPGGHPTGTAGAVVMVDIPDLRGVLIDWRAHDVLVDAAQEAWFDDPHREGEETAEFARLTSTIGEAMAVAMRTILTAAGMEVSGTGNDYAPHELLVTRRLVPSAWSARRDARFSRRFEAMGAAWNARHAAECPNPDCEHHHPK